jgi:hypothetical protein
LGSVPGAPRYQELLTDALSYQNWIRGDYCSGDENRMVLVKVGYFDPKVLVAGYIAAKDAVACLARQQRDILIC